MNNAELIVAIDVVVMIVAVMFIVVVVVAVDDLCSDDYHCG